MSTTTISFRISDETKKRYLTLIPEGPTCSEENFLKLLDAAENKSLDNSDEIIKLRSENTRLSAELFTVKEAASLQLENDGKKLSELQRELLQKEESFNNLNNSYLQVKDELDQLYENIDHTSKQTNNDEMLLSVNEKIQRLLGLTAQKLSDKYKRFITPSEILTKMFIRYTVERYTNWFYPFCISDSEIQESTGVSVNEWHKFINQ